MLVRAGMKGMFKFVKLVLAREGKVVILELVPMLRICRELGNAEGRLPLTNKLQFCSCNWVTLLGKSGNDEIPGTLNIAKVRRQEDAKLLSSKPDSA